MPTKKRKYKADTVRAAFHPYFVGEELDGEQRMYCPVCEDPLKSKSPSGSINPDEGLWNCLKGNHGGQIVDLVADLKTMRGFDIRREAMKGRHSDPEYAAEVRGRLNTGPGPAKPATPLPDADKIESWTTALLNNKTKLKALQDSRGIERSTIIDFELGWDGERYTIPVREANGELVNVRRYKLNAGAANNKMVNIPGHGAAHLYNARVLADNDHIVITEGEMDCILLNQEGIPAVTHTAGAKTFRPQWGKEFIGKEVWVAYDADEAGRAGARKVEAALKSFAAGVYTIKIPETTKGADVTDYLFLEGHTATEFQELMASALDDGGVKRPSSPLAESGEHISLNESMAQSNQAKTMELVVSVAGKQQEPYTAPKRFTITCDQSKGAVCELCPIAGMGGQGEFEIRPDSEDVMRFIDVPEQRRKALLQEVSGARCKDRSEYTVDENYHIEELLVQPSVDDRRDDEDQKPVKRTAFSVATHASSVNTKVRLIGKNVPEPKSGKLRLQTWVNQSVEMDIDKFELTDELKQRLSIFQPDKGQTPLDKCFDIAEDLSENVTHIYGRDDLHVGYDLVWHSPVSFKVNDMVVQKGWLEAAVAGDTRTGKSETAIRLAQHYRSGVVQSCEGMSFAGIVGGVQQIDGRWHMTWGVVPMNDRRMVVLDEVSGLKDKDVIEQMSSIRSSGVAQITKISAEETSARTRLIWIMNPADGSMLKDNPQKGIGALRSVVPNAEDIARFDFVMAAAKGDVDAKTINSSFSESRSPRYSSEDCEALVKWVWSLTRDGIEISDKAAGAAIDAALDLGERYISDPPIIQSENVRFKVLRIAAAIAARTFSINKAGKLYVKEIHVQDAVRFLDRIYSEPALDYARMSSKQLRDENRAVEKKQNLIAYLRERQHDVLLTLRMVGGNNFRTRDFVDFGGMDITVAKSVVSTLLGWNVIKLKSRGDIGMGPILVAAVQEIEQELADEL